MRNRILIFSQNNHAFLINDIKYASECFKEVIIVCPYNSEFEKKFVAYQNVKQYYFKKNELYKCMLQGLPSIFLRDKKDELSNAKEKGLFSLGYFKDFIKFIGLEYLLSNAIKKAEINDDNSSDWILLSAWYFGTAYAVHKAKEILPNLKTVTLVHSFEIDDKKNKYIEVLFRKIYHPSFDKVVFISEKMRQSFEEKIAPRLNLLMNNISVTYLGTRKACHGYCPLNSDDHINIVSCSNVIPVKRLFLLFDALNTYSDTKVVWTHIGAGKEFLKLKNIVKEKINPNLKVHLLGKKTNNEIHEYYVNNSVDVFINVSSSEGIPVSVMEAIAYGVPIILTDVGGNSEIISINFGVLLSADPNTKEIHQALGKIKKMKIDEIRKNAVAYYEEKFNSDRIRPEFFEALRNSE